MNKSFRVGHQTENIPLFIADACNIHDRAIGIVRISPSCCFRFRIPLPLTAAIGQGDLAVIQQSLGELLVAQVLDSTDYSLFVGVGEVLLEAI